MTMSSESKQISISPIATLYLLSLHLSNFCLSVVYAYFLLSPVLYLSIHNFSFFTLTGNGWKKTPSFSPRFTYYFPTDFIACLNIFGDAGDGSCPTSYKSKVIQTNRRHEPYMQSLLLSDVGL